MSRVDQRRLIVGALAGVAALAWTGSALDAETFVHRAEPADVGLIELEESPQERPSPLSAIFKNAGGTTLRELVDAIKGAAANESLEGLVIRIRGAELGLTQVEEIGQAIAKARAAGKKVHIFSESYETPEILLGSFANDVIIQEGGPVSFPGMYMQEMYLADTLAWAGVKAELIQVGDYKGANEAMVNSAPSPAWEQNISGLLDGLYGHIRERVKEGRKLDDAKLDDAMRKAWLASEATGKQVGLVDESMDLPDLTEHLKKKYNAAIEWTNILEADAEDHSLAVSNPLAIFSQLMKPKEKATTRDTIAIVHIDGAIVDGESTGGGLGGERQVGSWTIRRTLGEIEDDDNVKGVIIRINSPGGSAIASEVMWQGCRRVAAKKPVWVSVGSMAASGGYYLAVAGDKVYVNPSSIVGSIGVVGGKMALGGLYEKLKVHVVGRARGPVGGLLQSPNPWTETERSLVREKMRETYDLFTKRVSQGRQGIDLSKTAEGRLFTGQDAIAMKMADKVGGLDDAIGDLSAQIGLSRDSFDVIDYPAAKGLGDVLGEMLGGIAGAPIDGAETPNKARALMFDAVREIVGPHAWPSVRDQMSALMQLRQEPVILASPRAIMVK
jgi:protease-4